MKLDDIFDMWKEDCKIDTNNLDRTSAHSPILHQKYLQIYAHEKLVLHKLNMDQKKLLKDKYLYYNGKMTKEQMDEKEWDYDPFDGLKVMKGDMNHWYEADDDIQKSESKIQLQKEKVNVLKEIVENIRWRHQTIKNILAARQFEAGA